MPEVRDGRRRSSRYRLPTCRNASPRRPAAGGPHRPVERPASPNVSTVAFRLRGPQEGSRGPRRALPRRARGPTPEGGLQNLGPPFPEPQWHGVKARRTRFKRKCPPGGRGGQGRTGRPAGGRYRRVLACSRSRHARAAFSRSRASRRLCTASHRHRSAGWIPKGCLTPDRVVGGGAGVAMLTDVEG